MPTPGDRVAPQVATLPDQPEHVPDVPQPNPSRLAQDSPPTPLFRGWCGRPRPARIPRRPPRDRPTVPPTVGRAVVRLHPARPRGGRGGSVLRRECCTSMTRIEMNQFASQFSQKDLRNPTPSWRGPRGDRVAVAIATSWPASAPRPVAGFTAQQGFAIGPSGLDASPSFTARCQCDPGDQDGFQRRRQLRHRPDGLPADHRRSTCRDVIPTSDFNSWRGSASPTGAFANEYGNLLYSPVDIVDQGASSASRSSSSRASAATTPPTRPRRCSGA